MPETLPSEAHAVITPSGIFKVSERVRQGGLELYSRFAESPCDLTAADLVATGEGNVTPRIQIKGSEVHISIHVTGQLEFSDGGLAHIVSVANYVIDNATGAIITVHVDKFEVKPIGG